jgi:hypothetical protein
VKSGEIYEVENVFFDDFWRGSVQKSAKKEKTQVTPSNEFENDSCY